MINPGEVKLVEPIVESLDRQREELGLLDVEKVKCRIEGIKSTVFEDVYIKESEDYTLELHLDTDDGNGSLGKTGEMVEVFK